MNTAVSLEWVRAPNERAPFRVHDAVIGFVGQYLRRDLGSPTRVLGFHENCSVLASAKYVRIDVCVFGVVVSLYRQVLRDVLLA